MVALKESQAHSAPEAKAASSENTTKKTWAVHPRNKQKGGEGLGGGLCPSLDRVAETAGFQCWCGGTVYCGKRVNVPQRLGCLGLRGQSVALLGGSGNLRRWILEGGSEVIGR